MHPTIASFSSGGRKTVFLGSGTGSTERPTMRFDALRGFLVDFPSLWCGMTEGLAVVLDNQVKELRYGFE